VSMIEQITVLLALTANLFDAVPIEKVDGAEQALQKSNGGYSGGRTGAINVSRQIER